MLSRKSLADPPVLCGCPEMNSPKIVATFGREAVEKSNCIGES